MSTDHEHPVDSESVSQARVAGMSAAEGRQVAERLAVLADPVRVRIVSALLVVDEMCVGDLALALDATEDAVSYGLRMLRTAGLVISRPDGRLRLYRVSDSPARHPLAGTVDMARQLAGGTAQARRDMGE